jgi:hypothetical protein
MDRRIESIQTNEKTAENSAHIKWSGARSTPWKIAIFDRRRAFIKRPLVDACVGSGKSLIYAGLAAREVARGGRAVIVAHTRELVEQNAAACRTLGLDVGINAAALSQRDWRAPVISASIQSVYKAAARLVPCRFCAGMNLNFGHTPNRACARRCTVDWASRALWAGRERRSGYRAAR